MIEENNNNFEPEETDPAHNLEPKMSPVTAAFFGLIAVFFLYQVGGSLLTLAIFGLNFQDADINLVRLFTVGGQILLILFPALLLAKLVYEDVGTIIRFNIPNYKEIIIFIAGMILLVPLLQDFLYIQNYLIDQAAASSSLFHNFKNFLDEVDKLVEETYANLLQANSVFEGSFIITVVAVIPAICEEIFFRGYVQKSFELRLKPVWAILITAMFFGLYHFNPYGLIALVALGTYFGFAAYKSDSIFITMLLHFFNNFVAVVAFFIFGNEELLDSAKINPDQIGTHLFSFGLLFIIFTSFIFYINKNYSKITSRKNRE